MKILMVYEKKSGRLLWVSDHGFWKQNTKWRSDRSLGICHDTVSCQQGSPCPGHRAYNGGSE